jgi:leucyl aminopeptidase
MPVRNLSISFEANLPAAEADVWLLPCYAAPAEEPDAKPALLQSADLDRAAALLGLDLIRFAAAESFQGEYGKSFYINAPDTKRVLAFGLGRPDRQKNHRIEASLSKALKARLNAKKIGTLALLAPTDLAPADLRSFALATAGAVVQYTYRSREAREAGPEIQRLVFAGGAPENATELAREISAILTARGRAMDLVNTPANLKRTDTLVAEAEELRALGVEVNVVQDPRWIEEHMPCFFAVARGSLASDPPKWMHAVYRPAGGAKRRVAVVGKSVIFDTGGYQLKPDTYMNTMKADMTGGATALAALRAIAELKPAGLELHVFCAATPNKVDSDAMLPDSIVNTTCGKKVEIRHTDAEGRLTLIDAVTHAERIAPEVILTIATLTGSAARAVGPMALMSNSEEWRARFAAAADRAGDPCFPLDVVEEDYEDIASKLDGADISNVQQGKNRGAQTAAAFVFSGVKTTQPIVHLDIAGGDMSDDEKATGIALKSTVRFLLDLRE